MAPSLRLYHCYAGQEYLFAGFAAFTIELAIREGELVTHAEPHVWRQVGLTISHQGLVRTFPSALRRGAAYKKTKGNDHLQQTT